MIILCAVCVLLLAACAQQSDVDQTAAPEETEPAQTTAADVQESEDVQQTETASGEEPVQELCEAARSHPYTLERNIGGVTDAFASVSYWLDDTETADTVLMTEEEITAYNASIVANTALKVVDMTQELTTISAQEVADMIAAYGFEEYDYLDGAEMTEWQSSYLNAVRNLDALSAVDEVTVTYGLIVCETAVRAFPSVATLMETENDWEFDYFQESALKVGEGVRIYHQSTDGLWYFVQAKNYAGWVKCEDIALCSFEEMYAYLTADTFVLVTDQTDLQCGEETLHLSMGCRLLYEQSDSGAVAKRPISQNGVLSYEEVSLSELSYHIGYLPYTTTLVLDQAMKLLNTAYGWGSRDNLLDCSSVMLSVYECFGFSLPRNTSELAKCTQHTIDVSAMSEAEKKETLADVLPGSMLLMNGHVVMYLGMEDDEVYVLHAFSYSSSSDGTKNRVMQCTITPMCILKADGSTFLSATHTILEVMPK